MSFETSDGNFFACGSNDYYNLNLKIPSLKTYLPEISKIANASFIVAGFDSTCIFRKHVPKNGPNIRVVIHQESPEILSLRSKIKELENQLEEEKKKRKEELKKKKKEFKKQKEELEKMLEDRMNEINSLKKGENKSKSKELIHPDATSTIKFLDSNDIASYTKLEEINDGSSGRVYKVAKQIYYALKIMKIDTNTKDMQNFLGEYEIMNMLDHPNIVKVFGLYLDSKEPPAILLEFCPATLESKVKEGKLTNIEIVFYIYEIVEGMKYVHFRHVIHRDLKPTNILIAFDGTIKICDFGISKLMTTEQQTMTCGVGTQKFMAPEIIDENEEYDEKVDVYSFGVLRFFVLSGGQLPKIKMSDKMKGKKAEIPSNFSEFARELIEECWNFDPKDRPSFSDILKKMKKNDYKLVDLSKSDLKQVNSRIRKHKEKIPEY